MDTYTSAYLTVIGGIWLAAIGFPVPEDVALLTGGYLCHQGYAKLSLMIPIAYAAVLSADVFVYVLGRRWASNLLDHRLTRRLASPERMARLKQHFLHHQLKTVFVGRFLPGLRMLVLLTAGAVHMRPWKFLVINGIAISASVPVFIGLGYAFSHSFAHLTERMTEIRHLLIFLVCLAAAIWITWHFYSKKAMQREEERLIGGGTKEERKAERARTQADSSATVND